MTKSIETKQAFVNLALAVADALEDPSTPDSLRDALNDPIVNELTEALAPGRNCSVVLLRGLACLAKSRDRDKAGSRIIRCGRIWRKRSELYQLI